MFRMNFFIKICSGVLVLGLTPKGKLSETGLGFSKPYLKTHYDLKQVLWFKSCRNLIYNWVLGPGVLPIDHPEG